MWWCVYNFMNIPLITELNLKGRILWYMNYISIKLIFTKWDCDKGHEGRDGMWQSGWHHSGKPTESSASYYEKSNKVAETPVLKSYTQLSCGWVYVVITLRTASSFNPALPGPLTAGKLDLLHNKCKGKQLKEETLLNSSSECLLHNNWEMRYWGKEWPLYSESQVSKKMAL